MMVTIIIMSSLWMEAYSLAAPVTVMSLESTLLHQFMLILITSYMTLSVFPPSLNFHVFNFFQETGQQILTKLDRKQELNIIYWIDIFPINLLTKVTALASYWQTTYSTFPLQLLHGFQQRFTDVYYSISSMEFVVEVILSTSPL